MKGNVLVRYAWRCLYRRGAVGGDRGLVGFHINFSTICGISAVVVVTFLVAAGDVLLLKLDSGVGDLTDACHGELDGGVAVDGFGEEQRSYLRLHLSEQGLDDLRDEYRVPDGGVARLHDLLHMWFGVPHLHLPR